MAREDKKLTARLPERLHRALKEQAAAYDLSLNQALVEEIGQVLLPNEHEETENEKFDRIMRESGLLANTDWMDELITGVELPTLAEAREWLRGVPLVEWIIEDRGPR